MRICYTGGGTLGHVLPAISVHQVLLREAEERGEEYSCLFIGSRRPADRSAVESAGVPFKAIMSGKLRRYFSLKTFPAILAIIGGFFQSLFILIRFRPDVLFSKGGFVSVPPVLAAALLRVPVVTHESDVSPGLATRINARSAKYVCVSTPESLSYLKGRNVVVTGNPLRRELLEDDGADFTAPRHPSGLLILVLGGSQGSRQINNLVWDNLEELTRHAFVYHQCGEKNRAMRTHAFYRERAFIDRGLGSLYRAADLVISRSGAGTVAEICHFGKASLLIPLGKESSRGDQILNAERMERHGAAVVLKDDRAFLQTVLTLLEEREKRSKLGRNAAALEKGDAAKRIARVVSSCLSAKE